MASKDSYVELENLNNNVFLCKLLLHDWDSNPSPQLDDQTLLVQTADRILCLRCARCHRERYDFFARSGQLLGRKYKNPIGFPKTHRYYGDELRADLFRRSTLLKHYTVTGLTSKPRSRKPASKATKKAPSKRR